MLWIFLCVLRWLHISKKAPLGEHNISISKYELGRIDPQGIPPTNLIKNTVFFSLLDYLHENIYIKLEKL